MHFDPVGTEQTSQANIREFTEDDVLARQAREVVRDDEQRGRAEAGIRSSASDGVEDEDEEREDDELEVPPARKVREGLPARFRMRHTPHYVDELLGDAPPRTVREIPITEIESPVDDNAELADLEQSIRRLGIIEPLLVLPGPPRRDLSRDCRHAPVARGAASGARYGAVPGARPQRGRRRTLDGPARRGDAAPDDSSAARRTRAGRTRRRSQRPPQQLCLNQPSARPRSGSSSSPRSCRR